MPFDIASLPEELKAIVDQDPTAIAQLPQEQYDEAMAALEAISEGRAPESAVEAPQATTPPPTTPASTVPPVVAPAATQATPRDDYRALWEQEREQRDRSERLYSQTLQRIAEMNRAQAQPVATLPPVPEYDQDPRAWAEAMIARTEAAAAEKIRAQESKITELYDALSGHMRTTNIRNGELEAMRQFPDYQETIKPVLALAQKDDSLRVMFEAAGEKAPYVMYYTAKGMQVDQIQREAKEKATKETATTVTELLKEKFGKKTTSKSKLSGGGEAPEPTPEDTSNLNPYELAMRYPWGNPDEEHKLLSGLKEL